MLGFDNNKKTSKHLAGLGNIHVPERFKKSENTRHIYLQKCEISFSTLHENSLYLSARF